MGWTKQDIQFKNQYIYAQAGSEKYKTYDLIFEKEY